MPLFILWLGIFETSKVVLIAVGVFFPVYLGVMGAIVSVDRKLVEVGRTFRLSGRRWSGASCCRRCCRPTSSRCVGLGLGWMFVVAAEFMGASEGLGYLLIDGQQLGKPAQILAATAIFAILGKTTDWMIVLPGAAAALAGHIRPPRRRRLMLMLEQITKPIPTVFTRWSVFPRNRQGEIVAIIGGCGWGKSTLLRAIAGLDRASSGSVVLDDIAITAPHEKIGIIFQEPRLLPWLSVADNIGFGLSDTASGYSPRSGRRALARVGLTDKADAWPRELSGGQAQRVAIARALVPQPEVLLLDEPFSALDAFTRRDLQDHLLDLWADARPTLLLVTHDVDEAVVLADRVFVMRPRPGRLFEEIRINLARPRDRNSPQFDNFKSRVLTALDRSLDRNVPDAMRNRIPAKRCGGDIGRRPIKSDTHRYPGEYKWTPPNSAPPRPRSRTATNRSQVRDDHAESQGLDRKRRHRLQGRDRPRAGGGRPASGDRRLRA